MKILSPTCFEEIILTDSKQCFEKHAFKLLGTDYTKPGQQQIFGEYSHIYVVYIENKSKFLNTQVDIHM